MVDTEALERSLAHALEATRRARELLKLEQARNKPLRVRIKEHQDTHDKATSEMRKRIVRQSAAIEYLTDSAMRNFNAYRAWQSRYDRLVNAVGPVLDTVHMTGSGDTKIDQLVVRAAEIIDGPLPDVEPGA